MSPYIFIVLVGLLAVIAVLIFIIYQKKPNTSQPSKESKTAETIKSSIILNSIEDGVMLTDENNVIQLFNPSASNITGWSQEEAAGIDYTAVLKLQDETGKPYANETSPFDKAFNEMVSIRDEDAYLSTRSNNVIAVDINITPLFDDEDEFHGYIAVFRDVTIKRKQEQERVDFISTASHEMRTPVAAIEGYLALALNDKVSTIDNKARGFLLRAHENSKHLGKLFQDLLSSSSAEDGRLENNPETVEIGELLTNLLDDLQVLAHEKGLTAEMITGNESSSSVVKPLYYAHVDPARIREAVANLFDNAVKYTETGTVRIGLTGDDEVVQIRVEDTGSGIAPENLNHLFQKFYRVDSSSTRSTSGTGLGLFICKKIVELYGGRVWAESEVGKGSTFFINLPRLSTAQVSEANKTQTSSNIISPDSVKQ